MSLVYIALVSDDLQSNWYTLLSSGGGGGCGGSSSIYFNIIIIIIIISDSVDDRDQKPRYGIEVLLNLSRYQPALGNERINTKWINTKLININKYFTILYCSFVFCLIKKI